MPQQNAITTSPSVSGFTMSVAKYPNDLGGGLEGRNGGERRTSTGVRGDEESDANLITTCAENV